MDRGVDRACVLPARALLCVRSKKKLYNKFCEFDKNVEEVFYYL